MNHVERFRAVMNFQPVDRLPRWEWAMWWDKTIDRWHGEGLPRELKHSQVFEISKFFGLDPYQQFWFSTTDPTIEAVQHHVEGIVSNMDDYLRLRPQFFPDHGRAIKSMARWAPRHGPGRAVPTFATIAEDMSYNKGPMISERHFDQFVAPYYRQIVPRLLERNIIPLVDTDGDVTQMVPWLLREGI